jgi:hypothetical protein
MLQYTSLRTFATSCASAHIAPLLCPQTEPGPVSVSSLQSVIRVADCGNSIMLYYCSLYYEVDEDDAKTVQVPGSSSGGSSSSSGSGSGSSGSLLFKPSTRQYYSTAHRIWFAAQDEHMGLHLTGE